MDVTVTIISGASVTQQNELNLFLDQDNLSPSTIGNIFELTAARHTDVNFNLPTFVQVTNEFGETATILTYTKTIENKKLGTHLIELESSLTDTELIRGQYSGVFTTTIDYL